MNPAPAPGDSLGDRRSRQFARKRVLAGNGA